jgi:hypothetical protein
MRNFGVLAGPRTERDRCILRLRCVAPVDITASEPGPPPVSDPATLEVKIPSRPPSRSRQLMKGEGFQIEWIEPEGSRQ